jgi:hypothetical protein
MSAEDLIAQVMARRKALGLHLRVATPDGVKDWYPKDHLTKARWEHAAEAQGYTVLPEETD